MRALLMICVLAGVSAPAIAAEPIKMMCTNPRQDYLVVFDEAKREFRTNPDTDDTTWKVLAIEDTADRLVVAGMVGQDSDLGFSAEFRPKPKIDLYVNDGVFQADSCRYLP